tara:strand:- start:2478 stop:2678 length:201 start_codon:yes stop_codon:yes gene_type:complete
MSKSKRMFTEMREQSQDSHIDAEYRYDQWMSQLNQKQNHKSNSAVEILDEVFKSYGEIFGSKSNEE